MLSQGYYEKVCDQNLPKSKTKRQHEAQSSPTRNNGIKANRSSKYYQNARPHRNQQTNLHRHRLHLGHIPPPIRQAPMHKPVGKRKCLQTIFQANCRRIRLLTSQRYRASRCQTGQCVDRR